MDFFEKNSKIVVQQSIFFEKKYRLLCAICSQIMLVVEFLREGHGILDQIVSRI